MCGINVVGGGGGRGRGGDLLYARKTWPRGKPFLMQSHGSCSATGQKVDLRRSQQPSKSCESIIEKKKEQGIT